MFTFLKGMFGAKAGKQTARAPEPATPISAGTAAPSTAAGAVFEDFVDAIDSALAVDSKPVNSVTTRKRNPSPSDFDFGHQKGDSEPLFRADHSSRSGRA